MSTPQSGTYEAHHHPQLLHPLKCRNTNYSVPANSARYIDK